MPAPAFAAPMRSALLVSIQVLLMLSAGESEAHGNWLPRHGGLMNNEGGEVTFELVLRGRDAVIHLTDHGEGMPTVGAKGTLTVTRGPSVWSAETRSGGAHRLVGRLSVPPMKGDRLVAKVNFRNGSIAEGHFHMR